MEIKNIEVTFQNKNNINNIKKSFEKMLVLLNKGKGLPQEIINKVNFKLNELLNNSEDKIYKKYIAGIKNIVKLNKEYNQKSKKTKCLSKMIKGAIVGSMAIGTTGLIVSGISSVVGLCLFNNEIVFSSMLLGFSVCPIMTACYATALTSCKPKKTGKTMWVQKEKEIEHILLEKLKKITGVEQEEFKNKEELERKMKIIKKTLQQGNKIQKKNKNSQEVKKIEEVIQKIENVVEDVIKLQKKRNPTEAEESIFLIKNVVNSVMIESLNNKKIKQEFKINTVEETYEAKYLRGYTERHLKDLGASLNSLLSH